MSTNLENTMQDNPIFRQQRADFERRMNSLMNEFDIVDNSNVAKIPEAIFVRDFLPLFCGEVSDPEHNLLSYWYVIAGTPYHPVNVVNAAGQFVIQVPPVLDRNIIKSVEEPRQDLGSMFEEAKQRSYLSPALSQRMINGELSQRFLNDGQPQVNNILAEKWNDLFVHYGKTSPKAQVAGANTADSESDFEIE